MRNSSPWQRFTDIVLSAQPKRRVLVGMALLALTLMTSSAAVMVLVAQASNSISQVAVHWWSAGWW